LPITPRFFGFFELMSFAILVMFCAAGAAAHREKGGITAMELNRPPDGLDGSGDPKCPCIGFKGVKGEVNLTVGDTVLRYPAETGGSCQPWDDNQHPLCMEQPKAKWCLKAWCYVDPCHCISLAPPKVSHYMEATYQSHSIYYSYETCGDEDHYTSTFAEACVNQKEDTCNGKCSWTGSQCLGTELATMCQD